MKLLVIDGNSIINRAYYGVRPLTTKEGLFTNAVYGFSTIMLKLLSDISPDGIAVAFDLHAPTFRHKMYDGYKAGRKPMPEELRGQFPIIKELVTLWGMKCVECEGFEADDILGTLAKACRDRGDECIIATGDRDSLQLAFGSVKVHLAKTAGGKPETVIYDENAIFEQYGVTPRQLIEVKSIMGDTSDNIPGVLGIGEKGALSLIQKFGSLDGVYQNLNDGFIKDGMRKKLEASKDNAYLSRTLAEIVTNAPICTDISCYERAQTDNEALTRLLTRLEMFSLIPRMVDEDEKSIQTEKVVMTEDDVSELEKIYFAIENNSVFVAVNGKVREMTVFEFNMQCADKPLLTFDTKAAEKLGVNTDNVIFDASLAAYLINPSATSYSMDRLCAEYGVSSFESEINGAAMAAELPELCPVLLNKIEQNGQLSLLHDIEIPLAKVLAQMETVGFKVDKEGISDFGKQLSEELNKMENEIYLLSGQEFNINSPKQLGEILFVKLGLPAKKKTSTGYSTDAAVLDELKDSHPIVALIISYRQLAKLKSTYCDGLLPKIDSDGRLRSSFNQTETRTGRLSSTEPNLQNIPVRTPLGRELRRFFIPEEGFVLIDADYSQIELRVLAHISEDKAMREAFLSGEDIHTITAARVSGLPVDMVTKDMRSAAKAVNFGIIYGISAFSLAKDIHTSRKQAEMYINSYLKTYSGVKLYMENVISKAKEDGFVTTALGRKRLLPELSSSNFNTRSFGERVARNMPIQGAAADIIKIAMIKVSDALKKENMKARLILQVHDELIVEAPENEADKAAEILKREMESAFKMNVPLVADVQVGKSWYECK